MKYYNETGLQICAQWDANSSLKCEVYSSVDSSLKTDQIQVFQILPNGIVQDSKNQSLEFQHILPSGGLMYVNQIESVKQN